MDKKLSNDNYYQISGWMINELHLKGYHLHVFANIYQFSQDGESMFSGSIEYIRSWHSISKPTLIKILQDLIELGLIDKYDEYKGSTLKRSYFAKMDFIQILKNNADVTVKKLYCEKLEKISLKNKSHGKETLLCHGKETLPQYNNNYNNNNKLLSNSNKFELSNNSGSDEPSVCSDTFSVIKNNNPAVPSVYETTENKNNSACAQNVSASSNNYVDETHNCVDTSVEQSELDEINALKKFKSSQSTKHKKGEKKKTDNPFTRCLNVTNSKTQYNERVKNALYRFLQFRIKCAHTDETVWSSLLDSLEDCIKDAPTKDEGKLNILREKVIMNSLQGSYRKFFPLDAKSISTVLNNTFTDNNIINNGLNNTSSNPIGPIDSTKLALNPDGTPMIF